MSQKTVEEYFTKFPDNVKKIKVTMKSDHLPNLSRFYQLEILECYFGKLTSLPVLPSTLKELHCHCNHLTSLPALPSTLEILHCENNLLTHLPVLPSTLKELRCSSNKLTGLPDLPSALNEIYCNNNQLTKLPVLPGSLTRLYCYNNQLTSLPLLPSTLTRLYCSHNQLTSLPLLPTTLEWLFCNNNPNMDCYLEIHEIPMADFIAKIRNKMNIIHRFKHMFYTLKYKKQFHEWIWARVREPHIRKRYKPDNLIKLLEGSDEMTLDELEKILENW